eukprot:scaffold3531_cov279-Prasinococcus_capsulatus_cf.AAC.9
MCAATWACSSKRPLVRGGKGAVVADMGVRYRVDLADGAEKRLHIRLVLRRSVAAKAHRRGGLVHEAGRVGHDANHRDTLHVGARRA